MSYIEVEYQDYEPAIPPAPDSPFTENQLRHMWRNRNDNGVTETGVMVYANGKLQLVRKRIPAFYEWQNKNKNRAA